MDFAQKKGILGISVVVLLFCILLSSYLNISRQYPYYFIWDMDLITTIDEMLIQSGKLPDHISHPGVGMYSFLNISQKLARSFGMIGTLDLPGLESSLSPLLVMAELTDFNRLLSPFIVAAIVLILWLIMRVQFKISTLISSLTIAIIGFQAGMLYHSSMIRTELYSMFFWCCAALMWVFTVKSVSFLRGIVLALLSGIFLGLAYQTKLQSFFYVAAMPFLGLIVQDLKNHPVGTALSKPRWGWCAVALGVLNLVLFGVLLYYAYSITIPEGIPTFSKTHELTTVAYFLITALILKLGWLIYYVVKKKGPSVLGVMLALLTLLFSGFLLSFIFHLTMYSDFLQGCRHLLYSVKMLFIRGRYYHVNTKELFGIERYLRIFLLNPPMFIANFLPFCLLVRAGFKKKLRVSPPQAIGIISVYVLAYVNLAMGTRFILRDLLWLETILNLITLYIVYAMISGLFFDCSRKMRIGLVCLLLMVGVYNVRTAAFMPRRINANYNLYGWRQDRWFRQVYGRNHLLYMEVMNARYPSSRMRNMAQQYAPYHQVIKRIVSFVFPNQNVTLEHVGIASVDARVSTLDDRRISYLSKELDGGIIVDNVAVPTLAGATPNAKYVLKKSEYLDKFVAGKSDAISVLPRGDLSVYFVFPDYQKETVLKIWGNGAVLSKSTVNLKVANEEVVCSAVLISSYGELPVKEFGQNAFFIIKPHFLGPLEM